MAIGKGILEVLRVAPAAAAMLVIPLAAVPAAAKPPAFVGKWGGDALAQCRAPLDSDQAPVILKAKSYQHQEVRCEFRSLSGGKGVWQAKVRCLKEEGGFYQSHLTLWVSGNRLTLKLGKEPRENYTRCK